ncbi:glycosyltransferase family 2 protein [bacterium]|nr:glycosyltransferase family 2 protein [bacterium]
MSAVKLTTVILTFNRRQQLLDCLRRVYDQDYPLESVIVVDNHSTDDTVPSVRKHFPDVQLICNDKNYGAAIGKNGGLRAAVQRDIDFVYLLDDDVVIERTTISELVRVALTDPAVGVVGSKILNLNNPSELYGAGVVLDFTQNIGWGRGRGEIDRGQYDQTREMKCLLGGSLLIRKKTILEVGFFDETFLGFWYEGQDFCLRAIDRGHRVFFAPRSRVWHRPPPDDYSYRKKYLAGRNAVLFMKKHASAGDWIKYLFFALGGLVFAVFRETPRGRLAGVAGKAQGMWHGFTGNDRHALKIMNRGS